MKPFIDNIEDRTEANRDFRRVIFTGKHLQLVLMSVPPGEELGEEVHEDTDQFFRVEEGKAAVVVEGKERVVDDDMVFVVPAGAKHNVRNVGREPLKMYTLYAPPQHPDGTVHKTRAEANAAEQVVVR